MSVLRAAYASPADATKTIASADLPALPASPSTAQRVAHLAALQSAVKSAQADVNAFLTQQMEHGKAAGPPGAKDDARDEENYGEEVVDEN